MFNYIIDTHCHLNMIEFQQDIEKVINNALEKGIKYLIIPATNYNSAVSAFSFYKKYYIGIGIAVGVHPLWCNDENEIDETIRKVRDLAQHPATVAIGEIGLDFYKGTNKTTQLKWLDAQLDLADSLNLPVILHNRDSTEELITRLEDWRDHVIPNKPAGVIHSFCDSIEIASRFMDAGFYLGAGGMMTFKRNKNLRNLLSMVPIDRLVVETDAPFLAPEPNRGKRNEPSFITGIIESLARITNSSFTHIVTQTTINTHRLFSRLKSC